MALHTILFYILAVLTGGCGIGVVVSQNIVRSAAWLLFCLAGTAGLFFLLGSPFLGSAQLLVYVGGTLVLVVFGVMLTAQGPFIRMGISAAEWAIATAVGLVLFGVLATGLAHVRANKVAEETNTDTTNTLGLALVGWPGATGQANLTGIPGEQTLPRTRVAYLLPFEIVSIHLLVVLIAAAYLARAKRRREVPS